MTSFARLDEAFKDYHQLQDFRNHNSKRVSSGSSSESLRLKPTDQQSVVVSPSTPTPIERNDVYRVMSSPLIDERPVCVEQVKTYTYNQGGGSDSSDNTHCLELITKVLENDWCKKILRNILLEEYMDGLLDQRANATFRTASGVGGAVKNQGGGGMLDILPSGTLFGLDLRTLIVIGMIALLALYMYDILPNSTLFGLDLRTLVIVGTAVVLAASVYMIYQGDTLSP